MKNEKRFIDANAADVNEIPCYHDDYCTTEDVQHWLNEQPTVDAVEVVRCKDCEHYQEETVSCPYSVINRYPNDFCSYGKKRDGDGNG